MNVAAVVCLCVCVRCVAGMAEARVETATTPTPPRHLCWCEKGARGAEGAVPLAPGHLSGRGKGAGGAGGDVLLAGSRLGRLLHLLLPFLPLLLLRRDLLGLEEFDHLVPRQRLRTLRCHEYPKRGLQGSAGVAVKGRGCGESCASHCGCRSVGCSCVGSWGDGSLGCSVDSRVVLGPERIKIPLGGTFLLLLLAG